MKTNPTTQNKIDFKNKKLIAKNVINEQHKIKELNEYSNNENNERKLWKISKKRIFGQNNDIIDKIYYKNELHKGSKATAKAINSFFIDKVNKLIEKVPKNNEDPMIKLRDKKTLKTSYGKNSDRFLAKPYTKSSR
jgi:hypothetical protein